MDRKKAISGPVQKAGALFSGGTTLLSALSPLISLQLSWDKLYYKQGNSICHSPPPTTGLPGNSNVFVVQEFEGSWGGNLLWISMPALMYPSLVKTNNLLFLNETESTCFAFYSHRLIRKKKIYIYIKHYIKSEFQEESILIKRDVLYDTGTWGGKIQSLWFSALVGQSGMLK